MLTVIHGRKVVLINGRHFAVDDKQHGTAQRIAMNCNAPSVYQRWQRSARNDSSKVQGYRARRR